VVSYNVTPQDSWDGIALLYDDFGTPQLESSDYSDLAGVTFGVFGLPGAVKVEFEDTATNKARAYFRGVTNTLRYYTVDLSDLESGGLDSAHVRFINFVVDQGLAGTDKYTGAFTIVTEGLSP
jgi:hypothetical protein